MEWSEFAERFSRELASLDRDTILIVRERDESRHYVQAMREPDRLYAEAVSNNFLDGPLLLTPADEEVLSEVGWRPPTADWSPANWWTELPPPAVPADFARLAGMMVTALRDVQGVRRPADLVYESFHRHGSGLIELTDFGIEPADPDRVSERRSSLNGAGVLRPSGEAPALTAPVSGDGSPGALPRRDPLANGVNGVNGAGGPRQAPRQTRLGSDLGSDLGSAPAAAQGAVPLPRPVPEPYENADLEERLGDAKQRGDQVGYFELLMRGELVLPSKGTDDPGDFVTTGSGDRTSVIVFTSPQAMSRSLGQGAGPYHRTTFGRIAAGWPDPRWSLSVNPGLPSEIHLDADTLARLERTRRTAEQAATVDAVVSPVAPATDLSTDLSTDLATDLSTGRAIRLPHGARLWWHRDGGAVTPVAIYDAGTHEWEPVSVGKRARRNR